MPARDRTTDFQEAIKQKQDELPESKRRKLSRHATAEGQGQVTLGKEYIAEAYVIVRAY
jgi:syntaxin 18